MRTWSRVDGRTFAITLIAVFATACRDESQAEGARTSDIRGSDTRAFDGRYNITYIQNGQFVSMAEFAMANGKTSGSIIASDGTALATTGTVSASGALETSAVAPDGTRVDGKGIVSKDGIVEGTYSLGPLQGIYFGFRYDDPDALSRDLDGQYEISFALEGGATAASTVTIKDGVFVFSTKSITGETFEVEGNVLADGHVIMRNSMGDMGTGIAASAVIDQKSIRGVYYTNQGKRGTITGHPI